MTKKDDKKICFVISPIGEDNSETRKRSDQVLKHIISPAVEQLGYHVVRADKISKPGIITTQIIQHIVDSPLVIADLTERNPNVFYELALRHAIRKPLVQMIQKGEVIPFDVAATRIIQFNLQDLDSAAQAKAEILTQVESLEAGKSDVDNPISVSLDLKLLKESGNAEQRSLAELFEEFKGMVENLPSRIENRLDPDLRKRRRRFHPMMFEEMMHWGKKSGNQNLGFLVMLGFLKDEMPWMYEIGMETYKGLKTAKTVAKKQELISTFEKALEMMDHPMMREFSDKSEEMFMLTHEVRHFIRRYLHRYLSEKSN
jgi:hypothetical protein